MQRLGKKVNKFAVTGSSNRGVVKERVGHYSWKSDTQLL